MTLYEQELYEDLSSFFAVREYQLVSNFKQYRQNTVYGFKNVIFSISDYGDEQRIEVTLGIRYDLVESIARSFLEGLRSFRPEGNTIISSLGKLSNKPYYRLRTHNRNERQQAARTIEQFLCETGFTFLDKYERLESLDNLFNSTPEQPVVHLFNQDQRPFKAVIIAHLNQNPNLTTLKKYYRQSIAKNALSRHFLPKYERLIAYLENLSLN
ncbi:MAG: hypothetical protein JJT94_11295 [Bernardetiaceae bacterium]|nr:hypothetical protein [Bernardetiaceae bacterium]